MGSTAIEHPNRFGRRGFDSHRARQFRRAVEFGLSVKSRPVGTSAFKPRTIGQPMDSHLASCPSFLFGMGRCALVIELGSSNCDRAARENEKMRVRFPSRNIEAASCPSFSIFDGSQDWVIVHHDVVAGSSPASGTKCRSSSVVEHVIPSSFLIRRFFERAVDCGLSELLVGGSNPPFRFGGSSSIE